ncbi:hypothetical protein HDV63DRAFT_288075 [Trichoderma sp. SZMC 28014]
MNISTEEDEDEAGYLLDVLLEDEFRPYGSRAKSSLDVASDNNERGAAVEESNPESNPPLVVDDSPAAQSPPNNGTQSPVTETPRPKSPATASTLSLAAASSSASPFLRDEPTRGSRTEDVSDTVGGTASLPDEPKPAYCEACRKEFLSENGLRLHLKRSYAHKVIEY